MLPGPTATDLQGSVILNWNFWQNSKDGIYVMQLPSRELIHLTDKTSFRSYFALSPDNKQLAFRCKDQDMTGLCTVDKQGRVERLMTQEESGIEIPFLGIPMAWWYRGRTLVFVGLTTTPQVAALYALDVRSREITLLKEFSFEGNGNHFNIQMSPDESTLIFQEQGLVIVNMESMEMKVLKNTGGGGQIWSPDGSRIAFFDRHPENGHVRINTISPDGSNRVVVYEEPEYQPNDPFCVESSNLAWSPDGCYLMFREACDERDPYSDLYALEIATQEVQLVLHAKVGAPEGTIWIEQW